MSYIFGRRNLLRYSVAASKYLKRFALLTVFFIVSITVTKFYNFEVETLRKATLLNSVRNDIDRGIIPQHLTIRDVEALLYAENDLERIQKLRLSKISDYCSKHPEFSTSLKNDGIKQALAESHFYKYGKLYSFLEPYKYYECRVAKAATTPRSFILWNAFHPRDNIQTSVYYHPTLDPKVLKLDTLQGEALHKVLSNYFGAIFVRDPIDKIISAYFNKFCDPNQKWEFKDRFGIQTPGTPTFGQVLKILAKEEVSLLNEEDDHFTSYFKYCNPCLSNFSFVGRFESHAADLGYMIYNKTSLHKGMSYAINEAPVSPKFHDCPYEKHQPEAFADVDISDVYRLIRKHHHDYEAFGYNPKDIITYIKKRIPNK